MSKLWIAGGLAAAVAVATALAAQAKQPDGLVDWRADILKRLERIERKLDDLTNLTKSPDMAPLLVHTTYPVPGPAGSTAVGLPTFDCKAIPGQSSDPKHCERVTENYCKQMGYSRSTNLRFREFSSSSIGTNLLGFVCTNAAAIP